MILRRDAARADLGASVPARVYSDVEAYYSARVAKHGATPLGVDWSCWATQNLRFVQLLKLCDFSELFALNDIGCGYGALAAYLAARHPKSEIDYLGIDLSQAMIRRARRRFSGAGRRFATSSTVRIADYSVASGVMNVSLGHPREVWEDFVATILGGHAAHEPPRLQRQFHSRRLSRDHRGSRRWALSHQATTLDRFLRKRTRLLGRDDLATECGNLPC